jgi:hypothetical protein
MHPALSSCVLGDASPVNVEATRHYGSINVTTARCTDTVKIESREQDY